MKKISNLIFLFVFLSIVNFLLMAVPVLAAEPTPENNPMCWTQQSCQDQFKVSGWTFEKKNWESPGPGGVCKDMGVCIPAGKTTLSIKIGTTGVESADLGEYIVLIYKWLVGIGGIVAAVLIIKGGFEWATSAGSPERVKGAQATIGGALMGLLLLLGSYTLLYTINPDLVRLRLPGIYMIRKIVVGTTWCKDLPAGTKVALTGDHKFSSEINDFTIDSNPKVGDPSTIKAKINLDRVPVCSKKYFWKDSSDKSCWGHLCDVSSEGFTQVCRKQEIIENTVSFNCQEGNIFGKAFDPNRKWGDKPVNNAFPAAVCNDGDNWEMDCSFDKLTKKTNSTDFIINCLIHNLNVWQGLCQNHGGWAGVFLSVQLDDPDWKGLDDWRAIGCRGENLAELVGLPKNVEPKTSEVRKVLEEQKQAAVSKIQSALISWEEFKQGTVCNIDLDKFVTD